MKTMVALILAASAAAATATIGIMRVHDKALPDRAQAFQLASHAGARAPDDPTPLTIVAVSPAPDARVGSYPTQVVVSFSAAIDAATVVPENFKLFASGGDGDFGNGNEVEITPVSVTLTQPDTVTMDLSGVPMSQDAYQVRVQGLVSEYALSFDGGDYVPLAKSGMPANNAPQSICFWYKMSYIPSDKQCIVAMMGVGSSSVQLGFLGPRLRAWKYFVAPT